MNHAQPSLLAGVPDYVPPVAVAQTVPREHQVERAERKASAEFIERYERFLIFFGRGRTFISNEVTQAYESRYEKLTEIEEKALGGFYRKRLRSGLIEKTGVYRSRDQGNASAEYKLTAGV